MKLISTFNGEVFCGFAGNIEFNMELDRRYEKLRIVMSYEEGHTDIAHSEILLPRITSAFREYTGREMTAEDLPGITRRMKTEIQLCAFINNALLGNVHKPGTEKEMFITSEEASPGCLPCTDISGHLRVIINFFMVVSDSCNYSLSVYGSEE